MENQNIFKPQYIKEAMESKIIKNNMLIDFSFGHYDILESFTKRKPEFRNYLEQLYNTNPQVIENQLQMAKVNSLLITTIMLTGQCNADCEICFTDRKLKPNKLSFHEIKSIIAQTVSLGSRILYIPGEGEPLLDRNLWEILDYANEKGMEIILFTNGILLSNDIESKNIWGITSEELTKKLKKYPIYIYHKLWSLNHNLLEEMMNINTSMYSYSKITFNGHSISIPKGLLNLLKWFPRERVGVEVVVEKRNLDEIINVIIPFIMEKSIKSYIEPIIHAGRCFGVFDHDVKMSEYEYKKLIPWLSRQNCRRVCYKLNVFNNGYLSYGMALSPEQITPKKSIEELNIRSGDDNLKDLYYLIHTNSCLVEGRYQINGCVCEERNLKLSRMA